MRFQCLIVGAASVGSSNAALGISVVHHFAVAAQPFLQLRRCRSYRSDIVDHIDAGAGAHGLAEDGGGPIGFLDLGGELDIAQNALKVLESDHARRPLGADRHSMNTAPALQGQQQSGSRPAPPSGRHPRISQVAG